MTIDDLTIGMEINNDTLCEIFRCSPQGGMRYSKRTNTLVLVSNRVASTYSDDWDGAKRRPELDVCAKQNISRIQQQWRNCTSF